MLSREDVKIKIDTAETILKECWGILIKVKHGRGDFDALLFDFQPKLAECLYDLMQFYHKLQAEKKQLIKAKNTYDKNEFSTLMSTNASFLKVVSKTIEIGKSLGDAFAWFFFRDNRPELDKHFAHKSTGLYVSGIGGLGELEFIKNTKSIDGLYVLYHGITTMLRIGDFSLYAVDAGIVGVGELKTMREGDKLTVTASITAKTQVRVEASADITTDNDFEASVRRLQKNFPSIRNQLDTHSELLRKEEPGKSDELYADYEYDLLDQLSPGNPMAINSDKSLLLLAQWSEYEDLFSILFEKEEAVIPPEDFRCKVENLKSDNCDLDEFIIGELANHVCMLNIPILWWDISEKMCNDIYFGKVKIATIFNPAKLLKYYIDDGFTVKARCELKKIEITKEIGNHRIGVGHFESICYLITNALMKTEAVYAFARKVTAAMESGEYKPNSKIYMHIHLNNFGKPELIN